MYRMCYVLDIDFSSFCSLLDSSSLYFLLFFLIVLLLHAESYFVYMEREVCINVISQSKNLLVIFALISEQR